MHWVVNTISTSEVPIPKAIAPKAPWVEVCESPQTIVAPGRVMPFSGPITAPRLLVDLQITDLQQVSVDLS
jgi:hypothetical protein